MSNIILSKALFQHSYKQYSDGKKMYYVLHEKISFGWFICSHECWLSHLLSGDLANDLSVFVWWLKIASWYQRWVRFPQLKSYCHKGDTVISVTASQLQSLWFDPELVSLSVQSVGFPGFPLLSKNMPAGRLSVTNKKVKATCHMRKEMYDWQEKGDTYEPQNIQLDGQRDT